jgi:hypothetical protein
MKIVRDLEKEKSLIEEIKNNFSEPRQGIHLTDLLTPRQAYWKKICPKTVKDEEAMYFLTGRGHEEIYHRASGYQQVKEKQWHSIFYNIDLWYGSPCELKTRRWGLAEPGNESAEYDYYLTQLRGYCAMENSLTGYLQVWCIVDKKKFKQKPEFGLYHIAFSEEELEEERKRLIKTRNMLVFALDMQDYEMLPLCPEWMCGSKHQVMVTKPYCHTCSREFQTDYGLDKHINSRTGKGHDVMFATYKEVFEPRCKWIEECRDVEVMEQSETNQDEKLAA